MTNLECYRCFIENTGIIRPAFTIVKGNALCTEHLKKLMQELFPNEKSFQE